MHSCGRQGQHLVGTALAHLLSSLPVALLRPTSFWTPLGFLSKEEAGLTVRSLPVLLKQVGDRIPKREWSVVPGCLCLLLLLLFLLNVPVKMSELLESELQSPTIIAMKLEPPSKCWELNPGPLKEHPLLLTTVPSWENRV